MSEKSKKRKIIQGRVVSDKMDKTVVIAIETMQVHHVFKKITRKTKKIKVHDEKSECGIGDIIQAVETRPLSREKRHSLHKIVERAK